MLENNSKLRNALHEFKEDVDKMKQKKHNKLTSDTLKVLMDGYNGLSKQIRRTEADNDQQELCKQFKGNSEDEVNDDQEGGHSVEVEMGAVVTASAPSPGCSEDVLELLQDDSQLCQPKTIERNSDNEVEMCSLVTANLPIQIEEKDVIELLQDDMGSLMPGTIPNQRCKNVITVDLAEEEDQELTPTFPEDDQKFMKIMEKTMKNQMSEKVFMSIIDDILDNLVYWN